MNPFAGIDTKLYYNEQKVKAKQAECIYAGNFLQDAADLTLDDKRKRFSDALELNQAASNTGIHFTLQFAPGEMFSKDKLIAITASYLQRSGYGDQPYLVYHHTDTSIPHVHIITITVRPDGSNIPTHLAGLRFSEPARKAVELEFDLIKASGHKRPLDRKPGPARRVEYGKLPSEEAIADALQYILNNFRYRSIDELNAILSLYNLTVKTGRPGSRLHKYGGLLYQILENGKGRGAPVKASSLPFKPTLKYLKAKFAEYKTPDPIAIRDTRLALDSVLRENPSGHEHFKDALRRNYLAVPNDLPSKVTPDDLLLINLEHRAVHSIKELDKDYDLLSIRQKLQPTQSIPLNPNISPIQNIPLTQSDYLSQVPGQQAQKNTQADNQQAEKNKQTQKTKQKRSL